eukprot:Pgem_evm1s18949
MSKTKIIIKLYFDFISPYAYFSVLESRKRLINYGFQQRQVEIDLIPVLFAGLLNESGQIGPAEIPSKKRFVYQDALRKARHNFQINLKFPPAHPFMPLPSLRLSHSLKYHGHQEYEKIVENIFHACWRD